MSPTSYRTALPRDACRLFDGEEYYTAVASVCQGLDKILYEAFSSGKSWKDRSVGRMGIRGCGGPSVPEESVENRQAFGYTLT